MAESDEFAVGDRLLGKLRIDGVLGEGGMGTVYRAYHEVLACPVALKVIRAGVTNATLIERFVREVRVCALLQTDHVARVMDAGVLEGGSPYMIMELLEGKSLGELLKEGQSLSATSAVDLILQAMEGLAEAHAKGVVHRDVKPDNLFLALNDDRAASPWTVKVLDFGISKAEVRMPRQSAGTEATAVLGTPEYMSPEQLKSSRSVDVRADIWSLGIILYELLAGRRPFGGETAGAVFASILQDEPPALTLSGTSPELASVVASCLEKDCDARPPNLEALAQALAPHCSPSGQLSIAEIASHQRRPRAARASSPTDPTVPAEPSSPILDTRDRRQMTTRMASATDLEPPPRRSMAMGVVAVVVGALLGTAGMLWRLGAIGADAQPSPTVESPGLVTPGLASPGPTSTPPPAEAPTANPALSPSSEAASPAPSATPSATPTAAPAASHSGPSHGHRSSPPPMATDRKKFQ